VLKSRGPSGIMIQKLGEVPVQELVLSVRAICSQACPLAWVRGHGAHALNPWAKSVAYRRRIPSVCLGRGRGLGRLGHRHQLLRC
jgi:hypothetical protein